MPSGTPAGRICGPTSQGGSATASTAVSRRSCRCRHGGRLLTHASTPRPPFPNVRQVPVWKRCHDRNSDAARQSVGPAAIVSGPISRRSFRRCAGRTDGIPDSPIVEYAIIKPDELIAGQRVPMAQAVSDLLRLFGRRLPSAAAGPWDGAGSTRFELPREGVRRDRGDRHVLPPKHVSAVGRGLGGGRPWFAAPPSGDDGPGGLAATSDRRLGATRFGGTAAGELRACRPRRRHSGTSR